MCGNEGACERGQLLGALNGRVQRGRGGSWKGRGRMVGAQMRAAGKPGRVGCEASGTWVWRGLEGTAAGGLWGRGDGIILFGEGEGIL